MSCQLIASNLKFLTGVDIRGNRITDDGIIKIINGIPKMKSFFVSDTRISDRGGMEIVNKLHHLELLWSENTNLSE